MKNFLVLFAFSFAIGLNSHAQTAAPALDKSPLDLSTYPANYPLLKIQDKASEPLAARVLYSRPLKNNRVIFGDLLEYGKVWRFGANENTEIEFFKDVTINKKKIKKGKYSIFAIPEKDKWTIILNTDLNSWGAFKYEESKDVVRAQVPVETIAEAAEAFFIYFEKSKLGFSLIAGWDNVKISLPISF